MARHTIGNRRGSVRGAPPDVYMGFMDASAGAEDEKAIWEPVFRLLRSWGGFAVAWVLFYFFMAILWAIGLLPDEFAG